MIFELVSRTVMLSSADHLNCFYNRLGAADLERHKQILQCLCLRGSPGTSTTPPHPAQRKVLLLQWARGARRGIPRLHAAGDGEVGRIR